MKKKMLTLFMCCVYLALAACTVYETASNYSPYSWGCGPYCSGVPYYAKAFRLGTPVPVSPDDPFFQPRLLSPGCLPNCP